MSKLYRKIIQEVYNGNPHIYEQMLQVQLDANYQYYHYVRDEWEKGIRTPLTHSISEWEWCGKPTRKWQS